MNHKINEARLSDRELALGSSHGQHNLLLLSSVLPAEDFEHVDDIPISPSLVDVIRRAQSLQKSRGDSHLTVDQLFLGLLEDSQIKDLLKDAGINDARVRAEVEKVRGNSEVRKGDHQSVSQDGDTKFQVLKTYGRGLVEIAGKLIHPDIDYFNLIILSVVDLVISILSRQFKNNPVLVGEFLQDVVEGLAQRIARGHVPSNLLDVHFVALDMSALIAGVKDHAEFEDRVKAVLKEAEEAKGKVILFIDKIHSVLGAGEAEGSLDAANLFKPMFARGQLRCIGTTSFEEYRKYIEKDAALECQFQPVYHVDDHIEAMSIIHGLKEQFQGNQHSTVIGNALDALSRDPLDAAQLSHRYITERHLPDEAIDLDDRAHADIRIQLDSQIEEMENSERRRFNEIINLMGRRQMLSLWEEEQELSPESLQELDAAIAKLEGDANDNLESARAMRKKRWAPSCWNDKERLIGLAERLRERVVGQNQAVETVAEVVLRSRAGLSLPYRPIGSFLFLGPAGDSKTELAKALAEQLFGNENLLIRIDMSEYSERRSLERLIGGPLCDDEDGQLTAAVRRKPYSVVLFDGVEKAHQLVFHNLVLMIGLGRLIDGRNRTVDFTNTVIILTSYLTGTAEDSSLQIARETLIDEVRKHFEPESLDQFDEIVIFDPLSHDQLRKVARFQMVDIALRLAQRGVALSVTDAAWDVVVSESYHLFYGGNPIHPSKRRLAKKIVTRLSQMLIQDKIDEDSIVYVDAVPGKKELSYVVKKKNGGLVDAEKKADILMEIPANEMTAILHLQLTNPYIREISISRIMLLLLRDS